LDCLRPATVTRVHDSNVFARGLAQSFGRGNSRSRRPGREFLSAWFRRWTTEIAVTDRRVIIKRGFIRRATMEMNLQKIESVDVDQSLIGRIFDYGAVTIRGVGSSYEPLRLIDAPLKLRSTVTAG
jgi:Bacterial PH domain